MVQYRTAIPRPQPPIQPPKQPSNKRRLALIIAPIILVVLLLPVLWISRQDNASDKKDTTTNEPSFDKTQFSLDDPTSPWVIANKQNPLAPTSYAPTDLVAPNVTLKSNKTAEAMQLRQEAATALEALNQAAIAEGVELVIV